MDKAVPFVTLATIVEIPIEREECRAVQLMQQPDYFPVFHPLSPNVLANLLDRDTPAPQQQQLAVGDVFIQDVHAGKGSWASSMA